MTAPTARVHRRLCPAKLNLALSVGPPTGGRGYHPIASWMVALDWGDILRIEATEESASGLTLAFAADAPQPQPIDWPLDRDLAWRALGLLEAHVGRPLPVRATLDKQIPAGAGLGGGSSDAAAMLLGVNHLYALGLRPFDLAELSRPLGSDIAFLVHASAGEPSAVVTGFGERLEPAPLKRPIHATLFLPDARCATAAVYAAFDRAGGAPVDEPRVRALAASANTADGLFNDLFRPAMTVAPDLRAVHARLEAACGRRVHLTGSGAAMFALAADGEDARMLADAAQRDTGVPAVAVRTLSGPVMETR